MEKPSVNAVQIDSNTVLKWEKIRGATYYNILAQKQNGEVETIVNNYNELEYSLPDEILLTDNIFIVEAVVENDGLRYSQYSDAVTVER